MKKLTKAQKSLLAKLPVKKHDPDGVTVKMVMQETGWRHAHAGRYIQEEIDAGRAVACWVNEGGRMVKAMKEKP